jgi:hypothetical protein
VEAWRTLRVVIHHEDEASASSMGLLREGPYARQSASTENIMEFIHRWIEAVS